MVNREFTAVYKRIGKWVIAWVEEIPGVNTQGRTKAEAFENLKEAILLVLAENKKSILPKTKGFSRELLQVRMVH